MMNALSAHKSALFLMKTAAKNAGSKLLSVSKDKSEPFLNLLEKSDPDKAAALRKEQALVKQILQQIESSRTDVDRQRKAAARERVERLKAEIAFLRLLVNINPAAAARQAARLARELSSAAGEYANAASGQGFASNVSSGSSEDGGKRTFSGRTFSGHPKKRCSN